MKENNEQAQTVAEISEELKNKGIKNRYEFVLVFDVENGNPNGDPDMGNLPRTDPETGVGIVTDVCIKRKVRNYIEIVKGDTEGEVNPYSIYVKEGVSLEGQQTKAYNHHKIKVDGTKKTGKPEQDKRLTTFMCDNFYDVRAFGAVMTTTANCGQVRGPIQINFAKSMDPVFPQELTITRVTVTSEKDFKTKEHEMGRKQLIPYGLYKIEGYISANIAQKTGFSEEDLELFWQALINMFDFDHAAARGKMCSRDLFVFKHDSEFGNAPSHKLFDRIHITKNEEDTVPRTYGDYTVTVEEDKMPEGVTLIKKL